MFKDNDILDSIKESCIENLIESLDRLDSLWKNIIEETVKLPVLLITIKFKGFKFEENMMSFEYIGPKILNNEGILSDDCFNEIFTHIVQNPDTIAYGVLSQKEDGYIIEYEDSRECLKIYIDKEYEEVKRERSDRIPILSWNWDFSAN